MAAKKILVVDDNPDMVELLTGVLRDCGHSVVVARGGLDALHQGRRHLPDLILLDLMLGDMDGFSVCELLRSQRSTKEIPVVIMSALAGEMTRFNSLESGAANFLGKPFRRQEVVSLVDQVLSSEQERQAAVNAAEPV
jgi:DNA-binding response OmpR family regulator